MERTGSAMVKPVTPLLLMVAILVGGIYSTLAAWRPFAGKRETDEVSEAG